MVGGLLGGAIGKIQRVVARVDFPAGKPTPRPGIVFFALEQVSHNHNHKWVYFPLTSRGAVLRIVKTNLVRRILVYASGVTLAVLDSRTTSN